MKLIVKIQTKIEVNWDVDDFEDEAEMIRELFNLVKDNPIRFMDKTNPEPQFFVAVSKG